MYMLKVMGERRDGGDNAGGQAQGMAQCSINNRTTNIITHDNSSRRSSDRSLMVVEVLERGAAATMERRWDGQQ